MALVCGAVELEIRPEPSQEEREAIVRALAKLATNGGPPPAYSSAWREQAVRENVEEPPEDD